MKIFFNENFKNLFTTVFSSDRKFCQPERQDFGKMKNFELFLSKIFTNTKLFMEVQNRELTDTFLAEMLKCIKKLLSGRTAQKKNQL